MLVQLAKKERIAKPEQDDHAKNIGLVAKLVALCLVLGFFVFFRLNSQVLQEIAFLSLAIPTFLQLRYKIANSATANKGFMFSLFYLIPITISFLINFILSGETSLLSVVVLMNLYLAFYMASVFASGQPYDLFRHILRYTLYFAAPLFVYVVLSQTHAYVWGRWQPFGIQPNWWGMMALGLAWSAMVLEKPVWRILVILLAFLFMVEVQSRGSIVALVPAVLISSNLVFPLTPKRTLLGFFAFVGLIVVMLLSAFFLEEGLFAQLFDYLANDVLLVNDVRRGVGSGLTGRKEGYIDALEAFMRSPLFGEGFGKYEYVHNGLLLTVAESGFLGLTGMLILLICSAIGLVKQKNWLLFGFYLSYVIAIMTFPRTFNINMTGFLFIIVMVIGYMNVWETRKQDRKQYGHKFLQSSHSSICL